MGKILADNTQKSVRAILEKAHKAECQLTGNPLTAQKTFRANLFLLIEAEKLNSQKAPMPVASELYLSCDQSKLIQTSFTSV